VDAILTDDGDVFVFGASHVIRKLYFHCSLSPTIDIPHVSLDFCSRSDSISIYTAEALRTTQQVNLSHGGLLLLALLIGGDYEPVRQLLSFSWQCLKSLQTGLQGCGPSISLALAQSDMGEKLLFAVKTLPRKDLAVFLVHWRNMLCAELRENVSGHLRQRYPKLAASVGDSFPNPEVMMSYIEPTTSWSLGPLPDLSGIHIGRPDVAKLAALSMRWFTWGNDRAILPKFRSVLWEGVCLRVLCEVS
jgi:Holliday junction resolvase YEN1